MRRLHAAVLLAVIVVPTRAQVAINELMASNRSAAADPDYGEYGDWLELYNAGQAPVDLGGYSLSDDLEAPAKWRLPDGTTIAPGGFLVVWADDRDAGVHASFKLSADGEALGLFTPAGQPVDTLTFGPQTPDVSLGRSPDGSGPFRFFAAPTPGAPNSTAPAGIVAPPPVASLPSGFYPASQTVALTTALPGATIRYTRDGRLPTDTSAVYEAPLAFAETGVLRAAVFHPNSVTSEALTATYLVGRRSVLPTVSLVTDPDHLFDYETGIYVAGPGGEGEGCRDDWANWSQDWERPAHATLFEPDGRVGFALDLGVKVFGGCSRTYAQKSLALFARSRYGPSEIDYRVFPDLPVDEFESLVLRNSGQDWWHTMMRDAMAQAVAEGDLDTQAYRPAVVYVNGAYWGIHNLREKLNEHYVEAHHGIGSDDVEVIDAGKETPAAQSEHYGALVDYLETHTLADPDAFAYVGTQIDVDAYLDYVIAEVYSANADWPGNNLKLWRPDTAGGRWRWMLFDLDFGFSGHAGGRFGKNTLALATAPDGPEWPNPPWSTLLLRRLLENDGVRSTFAQRMAARVSTTYAPPRVIAAIDSFQARIAPEILWHQRRWPASLSRGASWGSQVEVLRTFARQRPAWARRHVVEEFGLAGTARLALDVGAGGRVFAEGVPLAQGASTPVFFQGLPLRLVAVPDEGYVFTGWEGLAASAEDSLVVTLDGAAALVAGFAEAPDPGAPGNAPPAWRLDQNHPNPFRRRTQIDVEHAAAGRLTVKVFDLLGREVATVVDDVRPEGAYRLDYDAADLPSGVYVYVMTADGFRDTRRMVVVR